jgi:transcriptional regulator with XRE-family HTH domain
MNVDIRSARRNRGLTLKHVADELEITKSALSLIERGLRVPMAPIAFKIASFYGYQVTDIWPEPEAVRDAA